MTDLATKHCSPCEDGTDPLTGDDVEKHLKELSDHWQADGDDRILGQFKFENYYETQAFVNAVAYIAHREDHHPDITFGYNQCDVAYTTHAIGGLSENDFISAAKIDQLLD